MPQEVSIPAELITKESFAEFGQVIGPEDEETESAELNLSNGKPRFYIMRLPRRGKTFGRITFHAQVTQCLGAIQPGWWYLVVAKPSLSLTKFPQKQDLRAFKIPHGVFVKLHQGTWHAGPLFEADFMDFYNLELSDTNDVDHNTHHYDTEDDQKYTVVDSL